MERDKAVKIVRMLGIPMYLRDGHLYQHPPGERINPPAEPSSPHGRGSESANPDAVSGNPVGSAAAPIPWRECAQPMTAFHDFFTRNPLELNVYLS